MNTLKMVQVFLTSIDSGSFTKAGEILGYTQSNLTQMMRSFEDELGIPLLIKTKKGVEPTGEAKQLLPVMRAMIAQEERFFQEADEIRGLHRGLIRIGSYVSTSSTWLPQVIGYYQSAYPDVEFNIVESGQEEMLRGLVNGSLTVRDLTVNRDRFTGQYTQNIACLDLPGRDHDLLAVTEQPSLRRGQTD